MPREEEDSLGQDFTNRPDPGDDRAKGKGSLGQEPTAGRSAPIFDESWSPPELLAGQYRIKDQVGRGGMGIVYRARDIKSNKDVAVKFITEGSVRRFRSEARAIDRLDHPNIVHVYEYKIDRQDNLHYIVMSFIQGESLAQRLGREGTIPLKETIEITVCLCEALAHAHGQGVIHRDIKPTNVLLSRDGTPILVDFGVARVNTDDGELTRMGTVLGTVDYMAPEQRQDARLVDARSDLWSLAATLYQMVTGEPPPVIDLDTVPQQLRQILAKALKSKKEDRYQTATEFADALQKAYDGQSSMPWIGKCFQCGTMNESSRKFCSNDKCAAALRVLCMSCEETIWVCEKVCGECGGKQADLLAERQAVMQNQQETVERLKKEHEYEECRAIIQQLAAESDVRLQHFYDWAKEFQASLINEAKKILDRGQAHAENKDYDAAIADYTEAIRLNPEDAVAYYRRGLAYYGNNGYDSAIADYTEVVGLKSGHALAYYNRGLAHSSKGEHHSAISDYTEAIRLNPEDASAYHSRGHAHRYNGNYDSAIADYTETIRLNPKCALAYSSRGLAHRGNQNWGLEIADYTEAIQMNPEHTDAYYNRGLAHYYKKNYESAITDYTNVVRLTPEHILGYYNRALAHHGNRNYQMALADYTEVIRLNPDYAHAYFYRGITHCDNQEYESAITDYTEAIRLNPAHADAYCNRGITHCKNGDHRLGISDYTQAIRLDPQQAKAFRGRGLAHFRNKDYDSAIADYTEAIRMDPQQANTYAYRGNAYGANQNYESAIADYTTTIQMDPKRNDVNHLKSEMEDRHRQLIKIRDTAYVKGKTLFDSEDYEGCLQELGKIHSSVMLDGIQELADKARQSQKRVEASKKSIEDAKKRELKLEIRQRQLIETRDTAFAEGRRLLEAEDYEGCLQELSKIDESTMLPEIRVLDDQARQACERMQTLKTKINDATEKKDLQGLLPLVEEYLQLNRGDLEIQKLRGQLVEQEQKNAARIAKAMEQAQSMRQNCLFAEAHELLSGLPEELSTEETNALSLDCQQLDDLRTRAIQDLDTAMQSQNYRTGLEKASTYRSALQEQDLTDSEFPDKYELCQEALAAQQSRKRRTIIRVLITLLILVGAGLWIRHSMRSAAISEGIRQQDWDKVLSLDPEIVTALIGRANDRLSVVPPGIVRAQSDLQLAERLDPNAPGLQESRAALQKATAERLITKPEAQEKRVEEKSVAERKAQQRRTAENADATKLRLKWNSIGMRLKFIPQGKFMMGSPASEAGRYDDETQHRVQITKPFYLSVHEVTQQQYQSVMGENPSYFSALGKGKSYVSGIETSQFPVERVSWYDAVEFCRELSEQEGVEYRLPTEAQWEYACRAGTTAAYSFGDNSNQLGQYGWHDGNSYEKTHAVGSKRPNRWGLYDMHGNVWEWCFDRYGDYESLTVASDPEGPTHSDHRVLRGGSYDQSHQFSRSAYRTGHVPVSRKHPSGYRSKTLGFRVIRTYTPSP